MAKFLVEWSVKEEKQYSRSVEASTPAEALENFHRAAEFRGSRCEGKKSTIGRVRAKLEKKKRK